MYNTDGILWCSIAAIRPCRFGGPGITRQPDAKYAPTRREICANPTRQPASPTRQPANPTRNVRYHIASVASLWRICRVGLARISCRVGGLEYRIGGLACRIGVLARRVGAYFASGWRVLPGPPNRHGRMAVMNNNTIIALLRILDQTMGSVETRLLGGPRPHWVYPPFALDLYLAATSSIFLYKDFSLWPPGGKTCN